VATETVVPSTDTFLVKFPILLPETNFILDPAGKADIISENFNLIACTISGKDSRRKAFQERLERLLSQAGESPHTGLIDISFRNILFSAMRKDGMF